MKTGEHTFTGDCQRATTVDVLCRWVKEALDDVSPKNVVKSFSKCGISNALDGTEGDVYSGDREMGV